MLPSDCRGIVETAEDDPAELGQNTANAKRYPLMPSDNAFLTNKTGNEVAIMANVIATSKNVMFNANSDPRVIISSTWNVASKQARVMGKATGKSDRRRRELSAKSCSDRALRLQSFRFMRTEFRYDACRRKSLGCSSSTASCAGSRMYCGFKRGY